MKIFLYVVAYLIIGLLTGICFIWLTRNSEKIGKQYYSSKEISSFAMVASLLWPAYIPVALIGNLLIGIRMFFIWYDKKLITKEKS